MGNSMATLSPSAEHADSAAGAHVAPLALSSLALTIFFLGADKANLFTATTLTALVFFFGGLVQLLVGWKEFRAGDTLYATTFATSGAFWLAYGAMSIPFFGAKTATGNELSYFLLAWTVFAGIVFLATMRVTLAHTAVFLLFFLTFLALTIGAFGSISTLTTIGGWLGIVTAVVASYTVLATLESPFHLPTGIPS
jgi:hypothetical protein